MSRLVLLIVIFILGAILSVVMVAHNSPYRSFLSIFTITMLGLNFGTLFPCWQQKKAIEAEHPDWKNSPTKGVKIPEKNVVRLFLTFTGAAIVVIVSFFALFRPVGTKTIYEIDPNIYENIDRDSTEESSSDSAEDSSEQGEGDSSTASEQRSAVDFVKDSSAVKELQEDVLDDIRQKREQEKQEGQ